MNKLLTAAKLAEHHARALRLYFDRMDVLLAERFGLTANYLTGAEHRSDVAATLAHRLPSLVSAFVALIDAGRQHEATDLLVEAVEVVKADDRALFMPAPSKDEYTAILSGGDPHFFSRARATAERASHDDARRAVYETRRQGLTEVPRFPADATVPEPPADGVNRIGGVLEHARTELAALVKRQEHPQ